MTRYLHLMLFPLLAAVALLSPLSTSARASATQDDSVDVKQLLSSQVAAVRGARASDVFQRAGRVSEEVQGEARKSLSSEAEGLLADPALDDSGRLLLAAVSLSGADPDAEKLAGALTPMLASKSDESAIAAADLLSDMHFKALGQEERRVLIERLASVASDGTRSPELRLSAANGWYAHGTGEDRRRARSLMNDFLASSEPDLRALGALALARSNAEITGALFEELRRLSKLPGEQGKLAEAYLEVERVREHSERLFKARSEAEEKVREPKTKADAQATSDEDQFSRVLYMIQKWHIEGDKVKRTELLNAALDGMLRSMDEHSTYMDSTTFTRFEQELEAGYGGIGAYVGEDREDSLFTITHPIYSGPAYRAGLMSDDKIVRVDDWPTLGQPVDEVIKRLKGKPGTKVKLYIWRRGMDRGLMDRPTEDMSVEIVRESITIPAVQSQMLPGKIGMVVLHNDFSRVASQELRKALIELLEQGAQGVILDLRNNSGGLLDEAVNVANLFLPKGSLVASTESRVEPKHTYSTTSDPILPLDMPMAVLVNRFTASAAEIVSGALQDHKRAVLVGKRSFGKGSVQNLIAVLGMKDDEYNDENGNRRHDNWEEITRDWNQNGEFDYAPRVKLTIARYLLPSGRSIHRELAEDGTILNEGGVRPDLEIDLRQLQTWRYEEMQSILRSRAVRNWVDQQFSKGEGFDRELFFGLADNDHRDPTRYPGFEDLYRQIETPLPQDDVRALVRAEIRRRVQDMRGKEYPQGDFVEDLQLQEAIRVVLSGLNQSPAEFDEYRANIPTQSLAQVSLPYDEKESLRAALKEIAQARRDDGKLSPEVLDRLSQFLKSSLDR